jgi:hypothetical protein
MSVSGTYEGRVNAPIGATPINIVLNEQGEVLTGTVCSKKGEAESISNGEVHGNDISFTFRMKMPLGKTEVQIKATIEGDDFNGFLTTPLGTVSVTAGRVSA